MEEKNTATEAAAPKKSRHVLIISAAIVAAFVIFGAVAPEALNNVSNVLFTVFTGDFGWLYLLTVFLMVIFAIAVGLSKYGNIKLGHDDDEPEFSNFSWFAQLFGGGMGIGLVFWSVAEPLLGDKVNGPIGKAIDILAVFATIFGVATSLGLGTVQITGGLNYVYGIENSTLLNCVIIAAITALFTLATLSGLGKAMQVVADVKVYLSVAFMVLIFVFGGAVFICNVLVSDFGGYLQNFIHKSLWMEKFPVQP